MDYEKEIENLKRRIADLESAAFRFTVPSPPAQVQPSQGCVCPVGAEFGCGNSGCPRRSPFGYRITGNATMTA